MNGAGERESKPVLMRGDVIYLTFFGSLKTDVEFLPL